jgi:mannose-1-phosphate guanylyltransferase
MSRRPGQVHAVVLAGGAGTRFWPLSREAWPKPLLRVGGGHTLLEETLSRAERFADRTWLVCGRGHAAPMRKAAGLPATQVLVEPQMRNTACAIALAAHRIVRRDPEAVIAVLSADHRIPDGRAFAAAMKRATRAAAREDVLVTIGVRPTRPETGYGYIRLGSPVGSPHRGLHRVARFVEKPAAARARRFVSREDYLWNAGIFAWKARVFLDQLALHAPAIARALAPLARVPLRGRAHREAVARAYRRAPAQPVDKAILERSDRVWCLPVGFRWSDVGTWKSLAEALGVDRSVTKVIDGEALLCDAKGNLVCGQGRPVVLVGVSGLAVIDAGDALLVADLERSGDVKNVTSLLREAGRDDLL